ncbi:hypothetical protein CsSME_00003258 [Camellia sinensis var. sinensis]
MGIAGFQECVQYGRRLSCMGGEWLCSDRTLRREESGGERLCSDRPLRRGESGGEWLFSDQTLRRENGALNNLSFNIYYINCFFADVINSMFHISSTDKHFTNLL